MATGSAHYLFNNETISAQIFYDWTRPAQVMNSMREDSYVYTIMHNGTTVWRLERANRSCCIDPQQTGVTPPRPGKNNRQTTVNKLCKMKYGKPIMELIHCSFYCEYRVCETLTHYQNNQKNFLDGSCKMRIFLENIYCEVINISCNEAA